MMQPQPGIKEEGGGKGMKGEVRGRRGRGEGNMTLIGNLVHLKVVGNSASGFPPS